MLLVLGGGNDRAYGYDVRARVFEAISANSSLRDAGRQFGVAPSTAVGRVDRYRSLGDTTARRQSKPLLNDPTLI